MYIKALKSNMLTELNVFACMYTFSAKSLISHDFQTWIPSLGKAIWNELLYHKVVHGVFVCSQQIVEELESLDLDSQPFDNEDKFKDWQSEFEDDYNLMRMK